MGQCGHDEVDADVPIGRLVIKGADDEQRAESAWSQQLARTNAKVVVVELGTGTAVPSLRHISGCVSHACRARILQINPRKS